MEVVLAGNPS